MPENQKIVSQFWNKKTGKYHVIGENPSAQSGYGVVMVTDEPLQGVKITTKKPEKESEENGKTDTDNDPYGF